MCVWLSFCFECKNIAKNDRLWVSFLLNLIFVILSSGILSLPLRRLLRPIENKQFLGDKLGPSGTCNDDILVKDKIEFKFTVLMKDLV